MEATPARGPLTRTVTLVLVALLSAFFAWTLPRADAQPVVPAASHAHAGAPAVAGTRTAAQQAFHDEMRKLWEDHVTWTRLAIVTFAAEGQPGFGPTAARLLQNQGDIGDAIKPFYGEAAGNVLTALLTDHITIAVELLQAAKSGDTSAFADAQERWYANSDDIADFLAEANPRFWPQSEMRAAMRMLAGDYAASVADYDEIHQHILEMADLLSNGLISAFPQLIR